MSDKSIKMSAVSDNMNSFHEYLLRSKEYIANKYLPYAEKLDKEADDWFLEIRVSLVRCVMVRDIMPGCVYWFHVLKKYISLYGLRFTKKDHIELIQLAYELLTIPDLQPAHIYKFCDVLLILLEKDHLISPDELQLDWEPLYKLFYPILNFKKRPRSYPDGYRDRLESVIDACQIYFPLTATQEILDKLRPQLFLVDTSAGSIFSTMDLFFPVTLRPKHHSMGYMLWFDELLNLWKLFHNDWLKTKFLMELFAKLAANNIGYIDWSPHLSFMFERIMQSLNLPVKYKNYPCYKVSYFEMEDISEWIVSVLGVTKEAQLYLNRLLKILETYFYAANYGNWFTNLENLIRQISYFFIRRLKKERFAKKTWRTPIPDSHKLSEADIDAFVKSMMPVIMIIIMNPQCSVDFMVALQYLSNVRPNLVIPKVIEAFFSNTDEVLEPQKAIIAMRSILVVSRPLVQGLYYHDKNYAFAEGPTYVMPILFACLPWINVNNSASTLEAMNLIESLIVMIPLADCSNAKAERSASDDVIIKETMRFEDFLLQLIDKIFSVIQFSSSESIRQEDAMEEKISTNNPFLNSAEGVLKTVLLQCSDSIFARALDKLRSFIQSSVLETDVSGSMLGAVSCTFTMANREMTLRALVPYLTDEIFKIIGDGEIAEDENFTDHHLLYLLLVLEEVIAPSGSALLPYLDTLIKIMDKMMTFKNRQSFLEGNEILVRILWTLQKTSAIRFKRDLNDPEYPYWTEWGKTVDLNTAEIEWFVPGEKEEAALQKLFDRYYIPAITSIQKYITDPKSLTRENLERVLTIIETVISGCDSALPLWKETPWIRKPFENCIRTFQPILGNGIAIKMPDGGNVRSHLIRLMSKLQQIMLKNNGDDTKSFALLNSIWWKLCKVKRFETYNTEDDLKDSMKLLGNKVIGDKGYFPAFLLEIVSLRQSTRRNSTVHPYSDSTNFILLNLFQLSTIDYTIIRVEAQNDLSDILASFLNAYQLLAPYIVEVLGRDTEIHHDAYKGVLYLIEINGCSLLRQGDWQLLNDVLPAIVLAKYSGKPSIKKIHQMIMAGIQMSSSNISLEVPDRCISRAARMWNDAMTAVRPMPDESEIEKGIATLRQEGLENIRLYNDTLEKLANAAMNKKLHWRHRKLVICFINALFHTDHKIPVSVFRFFLDNLISDSKEERITALKNVILIFDQMKPKYQKVEVEIEKCDYHLKPGPRKDNAWLRYVHEERPQTAEQWNKCHFVHKLCIGYYAWPKKVMAYLPKERTSADDRQLDEYEAEVHRFFGDKQNIEKLLKFLSEEEISRHSAVQTVEMEYHIDRFYLFQGLFRNHGKAYINNFLPHLRLMVQSMLITNQCSAAEIISGIINGSKYWPFEDIRDMWKELIPIIVILSNNLTEEMLDNWFSCLANSFWKTDPKMMHWLFDHFMGEVKKAPMEISLPESSKLQILQAAIECYSWRVTDILKKILSYFESLLLTNVPFNMMRMKLASILVTIFSIYVQLPDDISQPDDEDEMLQGFLNNLYDKLEPLLTVENTKSPENLVSFRLLDTICIWIRLSIMNVRLIKDTKYFFKFFPIISKFETEEKDLELSKQCSQTMATLATANVLPSNLPTVLQAINDMSNNKSWSLRGNCIQFLQVFLFHNMFTFLSNEAWISDVRAIVLRLLQDEHLEVRECAAQLLNGMLHCNLFADPEALLNEFKKWAKTKLADKKRVSASKFNGAICLRHAGVLGMCAFILAHPYDVPKNIPPIFEHLNCHLTDPEPIPKTIRITLNDFKRTHCDNWTGFQKLAQEMTEEQFNLLHDLTVPPSYIT